jgi:hypothetical protein
MAELPDTSVINILQSFVCRNHTRFIPAPQNKAAKRRNMSNPAQSVIWQLKQRLAESLKKNSCE